MLWILSDAKPQWEFEIMQLASISFPTINHLHWQKIIGESDDKIQGEFGDHFWCCFGAKYMYFNNGRFAASRGSQSLVPRLHNIIAKQAPGLLYIILFMYNYTKKG